MAAGATPAPASAVIGGIVLAWFGLCLTGLTSERRRHLVWEVQALGILTLGVGWLAVLGSAGLLGP